MNKPKTKPKRHRSRCAAEDCRKLYRHADPRSQTCSDPCRQRVYRARLKAAEEFEREQIAAERQARWERVRVGMQAKAAEYERQVESNRQPAPAPAPAPAPSRNAHHTPLAPRERTVIIKLPDRAPMTPIF